MIIMIIMIINIPLIKTGLKDAGQWESQVILLKHIKILGKVGPSGLSFQY